MLLQCLFLLMILHAPTVYPQKFSALTFLRVDQDKECNVECTGSPQKTLCASDGRTFMTRCEFQRAKCRDPQLEIAYRGSCKEVSRCVAERKYTQQQARKVFPQVFVPECNEDGTYSQVQCHSYTGYCWCVTPNGRPISGTAVANKTPRCPGAIPEKLPRREAGKTDDSTAASLDPQPQGDEEDITSHYPSLWTERVRSRQTNRTRNPASSCDQEHQSAQEDARQHKNEAIFIPECANGGLYKPVQCHPSTGYCWCVLVDTGRPIPGTSTRYEQPKCDGNARAHPTKPKNHYKNRHLQASSCDQEHQSAQEDARQHKNEAIFIPECANGGLYKPVQCHPSTGYCWCVLVDTGRPIPGTSTRYEQPKCDGNARAHPTKPKDHYKSRHLQGCPGEKKNEFLTSVLDALSTDMVHAVSDPSSASRISEPDPNHTLEERVVYWYFNQLDKNSSGDIGKKEIKPFKRFLRKKSKPKKCVKKFVEYCDVNNDKALSVQELMGCLGVTKEEAPKNTEESTSSNKQHALKKQG